MSAHAWVATWLGDPSPRADGRLTFNPIPHLDPLGTAMFVITAFVSNFIFGWAKPVMINPRHFRRPQVDMAIVAAAGPATNLLLALGCVDDVHRLALERTNAEAAAQGGWTYLADDVLPHMARSP